MRIEQMLELGWINLDADLKLASQLRAKAESYGSENQSQPDAQAVFVEPILRGLGWDTLTTAEVRREGQRNFPLGDLWLLVENGSKIAVIIDVKPITLRSIRERDRRQLETAVRTLLEAEEGDPGNNRKWRLDRGDGRAFLYGILTNGRKWEIYDFGVQKAGPDASENAPILLAKFDLLTPGEGWGELSSHVAKEVIERKVSEFLDSGDHQKSKS
jgi:hypothetical protein